MTVRRLPLLAVLRERFPGRGERELAAAVMRGLVRVDGEPVLKPGAPVRADSRIDLPAAPSYVSRGGYKLAAALAAWRPPVRGAVFLDAGASTGGFTDCLLAHGAALVHSVDVGMGQLAWALRTDPRVRVHEGTNVMAIQPGDLVPSPDAVVADLSFRSLRGAAAHLLGLTGAGWGVFLVKPQFELRTPRPSFRGVVRDAEELAGIMRETLDGLWSEGAYVRRLLPSPVTGRHGNREFLVLLSNRRGGSRAAALAALERSLPE